MTRSRHRSGRPWQRTRRAMFTLYGTKCHLCGHEGAGDAGHDTALAHDPGQPLDPTAMRPVHGALSPCPTCGRHCNQEQGTRPFAAAQLHTSEDW